MIKLFKLFFFALICVFLSACKNDKGTPDYNGYPDEMGKLFFTKCSTAGCHNDVSKDAASGLTMESWLSTMNGGRSSACVIPYRPEFSTIMYYINTYPDIGAMLTPVMPFGAEPLSRSEVLAVKKWIEEGAPNSDGFVRFSDNDLRSKFYVANQGCDVVTVLDQETLLPMRFIDVGSSVTTESPYDIKVSKDSKYWYVVSILGNTIQKFRASDDSLVGEAILGFNFWTNITLTSDGSTAFVSGKSLNGEIAEVNLNTFEVINHKGFKYPSGSCLNLTEDTLYVTQETSSDILYKVPVNNFAAKVQLNLDKVSPFSALQPGAITFSWDYSKYYVTCQNTAEVRVYQGDNDSLLDIVSVGTLPSVMTISKKYNYMFVSCQEDSLSFPGKRGTVAVIDLETNSLIKKLYTGHQPRGLAADDRNGLVYVAHRNSSEGGPKPHHSFDISTCNGRNGYVTFIEMSALDLYYADNGSDYPLKVELAVDPYVLALRK